ncbi:Holliday junction resolvase RuvX [candidate division WOR-3 bacterium]|nr:Holliday junction resolvase RuvX [candidate division WOR-3 bacterium]
MSDRISQKNMNSRILSIDPGRKKCGLSISDEMRLISKPLMTVERKKLFDVLAQLIKDYEIQEIVVGQTVTSKGPYRPSALLAKKISNFFGIKVSLYDENLSTRRAKDVKSKKHGDDAIAAAVILQDYLNEKSSNG